MYGRFALMTGLLVVGTACPQIERTTFTFDLTTGTGEMHLYNVRSDAPATAVNDFLDVVERAVQGTYYEEQHPKWRITSKELVANGSNLDGIVKFTFDTPAEAGIYKHDKKSPYIWCSPETIVATNGKRIDDVLPGCVAWEKGARILEITVKGSDFYGTEVSLLPFFEQWKAGATLTRVADAPAEETPPAEEAPAPAVPAPE